MNTAVSGEAIQGQDELERLTRISEDFCRAIGSAGSPLEVEATRLIERLRERRFDVAVVGEFNRGKSTLLNKLIEKVVLPSGVLPVTSIVTEITYGPDEQARVTFEDGTDQVIDLTELDKYVSEEENPGNIRKIATAHVTLPSSVLRHGAVLLDTPGVGSIFRHNTELARKTILEVDGAIMVMSADEPITDAERSLIRLLGQRSQRTFFVLNRIDHLEPDELERVTWFVENVLQEVCGQQQPLYCVSAKAGGDGFEKFASAFESFLAEEMDVARLSLARADVQAIVSRVGNECAVQESAMSMSQSELQDRVEQFRSSSEWQHEAFGDDVVLFEYATRRINEEVQVRTELSITPDEEESKRIRELVEGIATPDLPDALDKAVEARLKALFEPIRSSEESEVEHAWTKAADRFERATKRRVGKLEEIAGDLFQVDLEPINPVRPAQQRGRFFYSSALSEDDAPRGVIQRMIQALSPQNRSRDRLLEQADERLARALRAHVERLRADLRDRVTDANNAFEASMETQMKEVSQAMLTAVERAQAATSNAEQENVRELRRMRKLRDAVDAATRSIEA